MLDDGDRRLGEFGDQLEGGVGVVEIVVAELLALELLAPWRRRGRVSPPTIERGLLMRVLAIAQPLAQPAGERQHRREGLALLRREPGGDGGVIGGGARIGEAGEAPAQRQAGRAVVRAISASDGAIILGGRSRR